MKSFALVVTAIFFGCSRPPVAPPAVSVAPPAAVVAPAAPPCPIVPVALVMTPATGEPRTILALDANGSLDVSFIERKAGVAKLDSNGCLVGSDGLWAEWAPHDKLWTSHEALDVTGDCLVMSPSRSLCIATDGQIETRAKNEPPMPRDLGTMAIRGYSADARCAGLLLVATFTAMMPSMAVVDGKPARAPVPEGSRCAAYRRP